MTARELVLQRWPDAEAIMWPSGEWTVLATRRASKSPIIGSGPTEEAAWENAARNLEVQRDT